MPSVLRLILSACLLLLLCGPIGCQSPEPLPDAPDAGVDRGSDAGDEGADAGDGGDDADGGGGEDDGSQAGEPPELEGILEAHNAARAAEGVDLPPLTWDPLLAAIAQEWAERCVSSNGLLLAHNPNRSAGYDGSVGENIAATSGATLSGPGAVAIWMEEKPFYNHQTGACSADACGHYTQIVWRDTLRVGCASVVCEDLAFPRNVVCNYAPAGNFRGERPY